jgi:homoserine O-acetyltransferase
MAQDSFQSSDSVRHARPLHHAREVRFDDALPLELGGEIPEPEVTYETWGELDAERSNAVLVCHAISGDSHAARHDAADDPGWWEAVVGPGGAIDTDRHFVICPNVLGGCRGTTGPGSTNPATGRPWGRDFPVITVRDMVALQRRLVEHLGIQRLRAVVGGSLGGHQALAWGASWPECTDAVIAVATSARLTSQAIAFDVVGRNAILHDPGFVDGRYYGTGDSPTVGLALARMLGHITYLSRESMSEKFEARRLEPRDVASEFEKRFAVGAYLAHQGQQFVERFDANSYLTLSMAMDLFDLGDGPDALAESLAGARCRWLVLSFSSDWLFPPEQSRDIVRALLASQIPVAYCNVSSRAGHDAFLLEHEIDVYGELVRAFLERRASPGLDQDDTSARLETLPGATRLERALRSDTGRILTLVPSGASVLDVGCRSGDLLLELLRRGHERLLGIDPSERAIVECARRGVDAIHADLDRALDDFGEDQFDVVILSQALQAVQDVEGVLRSMLRVGRRAIVSFPNAARTAQRERLARDGRAPESSLLHPHSWYAAPPLRLLSILDFETFCSERGIFVERLVALDAETGVTVVEDANRLADLAIFVLRG